MYVVRFCSFFVAHIFLVVLFFLEFYFFYFLSLSIAIFIVYKLGVTLSLKKIFSYLFATLFLAFAYGVYEDTLYNLFLDLGIGVNLISVNSEILVLLTSLHLFILYLLSYNKAKLI
jgi:hypothetical protein